LKQALAKIQDTWLRGPSNDSSGDSSRDPSRKMFDLVLMDGFMPNMTG
jgi:CheY-like chemotaxis protein